MGHSQRSWWRWPAAALVCAPLAFAIMSGSVRNGARAFIFLPIGTAGHPLGTDREGADFATTLARGACTSFVLAAIGTGLVLVAALAYGALQGLTTRRRVALVLSLGALGMLALPDLAVLIAVRGAWPREISWLAGLNIAPLVNASMIATLALLAAPDKARLFADRISAVNSMLFVTAARTIGASRWRILWTEIRPHLLSDIAWIAAVVFPRFVQIEVGMTYIGIGYRDTAGLGPLLKSSFENFQHPVARSQLALAALVVIWLALVPQVVMGLVRKSDASRGTS